MIFLINKAWQDYYNQLVAGNSNDQKHLFKISKKLLSNDNMGSFLERKIANIHADLQMTTIHHRPALSALIQSRLNHHQQRLSEIKSGRGV